MDPDDLPYGTISDIVLADAGPLRLLSQIDMLHLLHTLGNTVLLVDVVANAAIRSRTTITQRRIAAWLEAGQRLDATAAVRMTRTLISRAGEMARLVDPTFQAPESDHTAIRDWLAAILQEKGWPMRVVAQDMLAGNQALDELPDNDATLVNTRAFLFLAERKGLIPSASDVWAAIDLKRAQDGPEDRDGNDHGRRSS